MKPPQWLALLAGTILAAQTTSQAALSFTLQEVGSDVVLTLLPGGSLNLTGLTGGSPSSSNGSVYPSSSFFVGSGTADFYSTVSLSGPSNFGSLFSSPMPATSSSGSPWGLITFGSIAVPTGYISGTSIGASSTSNWTGQTLSSMNVTTGVYTWTLGNTDTVTLTVGSVTPVPEAGPGAIAGLGLAVATLRQLRRRRQAL